VTERASDLEKISSAIPPTVLLWRPFGKSGKIAQAEECL